MSAPASVWAVVVLVLWWEVSGQNIQVSRRVCVEELNNSGGVWREGITMNWWAEGKKTILEGVTNVYSVCVSSCLSILSLSDASPRFWNTQLFYPATHLGDEAHFTVLFDLVVTHGTCGDHLN